MELRDLTRDELLVLGGLVRLAIHSDGHFSEAEEAKINEIGLELGSEGALWRWVSASAQAHADDAAIRHAASTVERPEARAVIQRALGRVVGADEVAAQELELLAWLASTWRRGPTL